MIRAFFILCLAAFFDGACKQVFAQQLGIQSGSFIRINYQSGNVFPTNEFVRGVNALNREIRVFDAYAVELGWQSKGTEQWQRDWALPYYGLGIFAANFYNKQEIGAPRSVYGFFGGPFWNWTRVSLLYEIGFGLALNWKPYDPDMNPFQTAIGSWSTFHFDVGLRLQARISPRLACEFGGDFTHFSNGSVNVPNLGLNMNSLKLGLRYDVAPFPIAQYSPISEPMEKKWEYFFRLGVGAKEALCYAAEDPEPNPFLSPDYGIMTLNFGAVRDLSKKLKFGGGIYMAYNAAAHVPYSPCDSLAYGKSFSQRSRVSGGVFGTLEVVIHNTHLSLQPAWEIYRERYPMDLHGEFAQRIGLKHHILKGKRMFIGVYMHAVRFSVADYIEWSIGYRWR